MDKLKMETSDMAAENIEKIGALLARLFGI